ncbi:MAG TPA: sugar ABC transporter substrate-binding protein [Candidatus Wallbacteria bacterium]|nr:sugar ABC transporter substrate-binding protein [Candidatus Wallbacteria bacterium]
MNFIKSKILENLYDLDNAKTSALNGRTINRLQSKRNFKRKINRAFPPRRHKIPEGSGTFSSYAYPAVIVTFQILSALLISFFSFAEPAEAAEKNVGVLYWSQNIAGQVAMSDGLEEEAARINKEAIKKGGLTLKLQIRVAGDGATGIENQVRQMNELVAAKADIIVVQPTDNAALADPLKAANKAGIPVVAYDQYISGGILSAFRTSDNYQAGYLDGEYISSKFPEGNTISVILVEYPHVSSTVERVNGFLDALSRSKRPYKIRNSYQAVEPVSGRKAAADILRDFPKRGDIDVVFTVNDGGGLEIVNGLAEAGRDEIIVATIDGDPRSIENIKKGRLTVIDSAQFCGPLGAEAIKAAYAILTGEKTPYHALVPTFPITRETLQLYPGWQGPIPKEFKKSWKSASPEWLGELRIIKY